MSNNVVSRKSFPVVAKKLLRIPSLNEKSGSGISRHEAVLCIYYIAYDTGETVQTLSNRKLETLLIKGLTKFIPNMNF